MLFRDPKIFGDAELFPDVERRKNRLLERKTGVFWDVDDYPVEEDDIVSFANNIKLALKSVGFTSDDVSITAYGGRNEPDESTKLLYSEAGVTFVFIASKLARVFKILTDMFLLDAFARRSGGPTNMLLISKAIFPSEDQALQSSYCRCYFDRLHQEDCNMLYVVPDDFPPKNFPYLPLYPAFPELNCIWSWSDLMRGAEPLVYDHRNY